MKTFTAGTSILAADVNANFSEAVWFGTTTGSANAYVLSLTPTPTAYTAGQRIAFLSNFANTGAATLNINGLGAKTIKKNYNLDLNANDILNGQSVTVMYDGTNFQMLSPVGPLPFSISASDNVKTSDAASTGYVTYTSYTKVKEILFNEIAGTIRVKFTMENDGSGGTNLVYGRIYKNGVAYGTEQSTSANSPQTFSQDLPFSTGDLIQLYIKCVQTFPEMDASNFNLCYDKIVTLIANTINL